MTYEQAKNIVAAVEEQKRAYNFHREAYEWLKLTMKYPDDDYYREQAIRFQIKSKINSKYARLLLGIEE